MRAKRVVPFITAWSTEMHLERSPGHALENSRVFNGGEATPGLRYTDERDTDRDAYGVLWARQPENPGAGDPIFAKVHAGRQRHAMAHMLCQVCGGPSDLNEHGRLWILLPNERSQADNGRGAVVTPSPPVCVDCVPLAVGQCPRVGAGYTLVRAARVHMWGVLATGPLLGDGIVPVRYGDPDTALVLAMQQLVKLTGVTYAAEPDRPYTG